LDRKRRTSATETLTMSCFLAGTRWTPTVTRSTSITAPQIARLPWLGPACALYFNGWTRTEVANAASGRRMYEITYRDLSVSLWLPAPSLEPHIYDKTSHIQGLLRLWSGVRLAQPACAGTIRSFAAHSFGDQSPSCTLNRRVLVSPGPQPFILYSVSYLAQTPRCASVILNHLLSV